MNPVLQEAVAACEAITRERAKNFHYGLRLTPPEKRWAMYAVYAWMREADDLVDDPERDPNERNQRLQAYRDATDAALDGHTQTHTPALIALMAKWAIFLPPNFRRGRSCANFVTKSRARLAWCAFAFGVSAARTQLSWRWSAALRFS